MEINSSLICFANCNQGILYFHTATQSQSSRRDSKHYLFVMNDGHLAQEKLQERVNFGEKYLSMIQLYLVLADFCF